jgi:hypothetical protein
MPRLRTLTMTTIPCSNAVSSEWTIESPLSLHLEPSWLSLVLMGSWSRVSWERVTPSWVIPAMLSTGFGSACQFLCGSSRSFLLCDIRSQEMALVNVGVDFHTHIFCAYLGTPSPNNLGNNIQPPSRPRALYFFLSRHLLPRLRVRSSAGAVPTARRCSRRRREQQFTGPPSLSVAGLLPRRVLCVCRRDDPPPSGGRGRSGGGRGRAVLPAGAVRWGIRLPILPAARCLSRHCLIEGRGAASSRVTAQGAEPLDDAVALAAL